VGWGARSKKDKKKKAGLKANEVGKIGVHVPGAAGGRPVRVGGSRSRHLQESTVKKKQKTFNEVAGVVI